MRLSFTALFYSKRVKDVETFCVLRVGATLQRLILAGERIWIADAHCDDGKRSVVHTDEKLTALLELESAIRASGRLPRQGGEIVRNLRDMKTPVPLVLIIFSLVCSALVPKALAVSPAPDGGYSGGTTAAGTDALFHLSTGVWNSAFGYRALYQNASGIRNTAVGYQALYNNNGSFGTYGRDNVAVGADALFSNTTGNGNIAIGFYALHDNTTGSNNIAIGNRALLNFDENESGITAVGDSFFSAPDVVSVGRLPIFHLSEIVGHGVLTANINAENDIYIGSLVTPEPFSTYTSHVHIQAQDAVYVGAVYGTPITGSPVSIDSNGQLGVAASSKRFKRDIKPMGDASEAILDLKPITFRYKKELDPKSIPQFGLVAEEVERVNPDLVSHDSKGEIYTVRYEAVNAMLLNEFLKEHRNVQELQARLAQQQKSFESKLAGEQKQIDALTAGLQKVSAQLEASKPAPQVVNNP